MKYLFTTLAILGLFLTPSFALAQNETVTEVNLVNPIKGKILKEGTREEIREAAQGTLNWSEFVGVIIQKGLGVIGSITLLVFVYGGFLWLTSAGSADRVQKGKSVMLWAAIGVFIIFSSYAILRTILTALGVTGEI